jgi:hypothetical protein
MHIRKYYELAQRIQLQGGPDNAQDLYVQAIHMEERVLAQYGLPPTRRFVRILQSLHEYEPLGEEALGKIMKLLELEASEYLLTSPLPDEELLTQAKAQHLNAMDILPEMGVPTQEYMVFVYNQYCRDPTIEAHQVIKEFRIADQQDTLQEILEIREENFPQRDPRYRLLKSRGLQFLDAFLREQEDGGNEGTAQTAHGYGGSFLHGIPQAQEPRDGRYPGPPACRAGGRPFLQDSPIHLHDTK